MTLDIAGTRLMNKIRDAAATLDADQFEIFLAVVTSISGTDGYNVKAVPLSIYGSSADTGAGLILHHRIAGASLRVGDVVVVLRSGRERYCLGLAGGDGALRIEWGSVAMGSGKRFGALDFDSTDFALIQEDAIGIDTDTDEVNIALAPVIDEAKRGIFPYIDDGTPVTATSNSISTYSTLATFDVVLPAGTWRYSGVAMMVARNNTANDGGTIRFAAPNTSGGNSEVSVTANAPFTVIKSSSAANLSGTVTFTIEYRASVGGTVTPSRWYVSLIFRRTA